MKAKSDPVITALFWIALLCAGIAGATLVWLASLTPDEVPW